MAPGRLTTCHVCVRVSPPAGRLTQCEPVRQQGAACWGEAGSPGVTTQAHVWPGSERSTDDPCA